jgi:hypothetical protein
MTINELNSIYIESKKYAMTLDMLIDFKLCFDKINYIEISVKRDCYIYSETIDFDKISNINKTIDILSKRIKE